MDPKPYYGPDESYSDILLERTAIAGDFLCGVGYGIQLVLYVSCASFLWNARKTRGRQSIFLFAYMTLLLLIETGFEVSQARTIQDMYVDHRNYPGGPWQYFLATQHLPVNIVFFATLFVLTFLTDLLVLWRCWIIWSAAGTVQAYLAIAFPSVIVLGSFVMGTLWTIQSSKPGLSLYDPLPVAYGTAYYIISLSVNIILTILITVRLLLYRRRIEATLTAEYGRHYFSLMTIIIESSALYSVFALLFIITYAMNSPINQVFLGVASAAQQIAGYLIIYRVAEGRAWKQGTFADEGRLQTLRFNHEGTAMRQTITFPDLETPVDGQPLGHALCRGCKRKPEPTKLLSRCSSLSVKEKDEVEELPALPC